MNGTSKYICRVEDEVSDWHILALCLLALAVVDINCLKKLNSISGERHPH
jgi:hypothetical protein